MHFELEETSEDLLHKIIYSSNWISQMTSWKLSTKVKSYQVFYFPFGIQWMIEMKFNANSRYSGQCSLSVVQSNSDDDEFGFSYTLFHILSAFYILVVAVSVLSFITDMIYNVQMIRHSGLMAVFSFMALYSLIADLCNISGTLISLPNLVAQNLQLNVTTRLILGLGCMMSWIRLLGIFSEFGKEYAGMILAIRDSVPAVLPIIFSLLPIFIGYTMIALAVFPTAGPRFTNFDIAASHLFSLWKGDNIMAIAISMTKANPVLGHLFIYTFIVLFLYNFMNVSLARIQECFFTNVPSMIEKSEKRRKMNPTSNKSLSKSQVLSERPVKRMGQANSESLKRSLSYLFISSDTMLAKYKSMSSRFPSELHDLNVICRSPLCWICRSSTLMIKEIRMFEDDLDKLVCDFKL